MSPVDNSSAETDVAKEPGALSSVPVAEKFIRLAAFKIFRSAIMKIVALSKKILE